METEADCHSSLSSHHQQPATDTERAGAAGPKACATCRLAHVSCDRNQPCARCMRLGKTDSCQPSPTRKRGRPRKAPSDEQPPVRHHQPQLSKRACIRPTTTNAVVMSDDTTTSCQHLPSLQLCPTTTANSASPTTTTTTYAGSTSLPSSSPSRSSSSPADEGCASFSQPEARSLPGHQRFAPAAGQKQEQDSQGLRSLLMLVVDQMREMRRENERLHDTIAQLCTTQKETERRLARMEQDYQPSSSRRHAWSWSSTRRATTTPQPTDLTTTSAQSSSWCVGVPHVAAAAPTTSRAEVERFIAQTLPFLRAFDQSSLIIRDLQRPFVVMHMNEVETLDDLMPIIVYASPSLCSLLGYNSFELHGSPIASFGFADQEFLPMFVEIALTPSPTPVGLPLGATGVFDTKDGRSVRVSTTHQVLYSQRQMVDKVLESAPLTTPGLRVVNDPTARAIARAHLLTRLPHSLLFELRGRGRELTTTTQLPDAAHHHRDSHHCLHHHQAFVEPLTSQQQDDVGAMQPELRADAELEELIRVLGSPSQGSGGRVRSPQMTMGFTSRPPPTPSSLAERWMR
ncbi:fungal Zn(2)-Cys(6) binuclear cluster domain containing protein [Acanthamoeba castellanii str. Neff]|uniref:Fungal Zn(2)-Cys(6) binuclear cluster domain containing protein n=1 Tax=Acanthamoeba castellanii (strain ATCC 30010 / Neff) TaxID=1257118 RepID=L8HFG9_ACACF|nr:fungal Zn(2)-Cys(6) binuclear cluster domain containing protein [Acanthamoeba castellanii str. Neff]ELR23992.1 fungal Zn(2)-Cys(6) binuclear cluster domain containing protein [Acanthamoeba castellanii str. Neff]